MSAQSLCFQAGSLTGRQRLPQPSAATTKAR
jgi:hypothetical protein